MTEATDFNGKIIAEFRATGGKVGGPLASGDMLLLHHTGAHTGTERVSPLAYQRVGESFAVFASKAGAPTNPAWYHNLLAHPDTTIEVGDRVIEVHATELTGRDRDEKYAEQARRYPRFGDYQRKTARTIPVIALIPGTS
jgi:deazaflavin-dependent oxidoreductase (nitroreductase family)